MGWVGRMRSSPCRKCRGPAATCLRPGQHACHADLHAKPVCDAVIWRLRLPTLHPTAPATATHTVSLITPSTPPANVTAAEPAGPRIDDWNLLRSFIVIYETGTLTDAAKRLGMTQPNMGRHLRQLEAVLGETLFVRLPSKLKANARADALYATSAPMHQAVRDVARLFTDQAEHVVGVVRLAVSEAYGYHVVPRLLAPLLHAEPDLEIELVVSNRIHNLLRRDADIAVRHFRPQQEDVIARKLGEGELGLYAHEDYIARFGEPTGFVQPPGAVLAGFDREPMPLAQSLQGPVPEAPLRFRLRSDSVLTLQAAVECGAAVGIFFADIAAERPGLRRVLAQQVSLKQELWICAHDELRRSHRMRRVWDHLGDALEARLRGPDA
jgi:DNA-binding transcriptional LysR family regulator